MIDTQLQLQIEAIELEDDRWLDSLALQQAISDALQELIEQQGFPEHLKKDAVLNRLELRTANTPNAYPLAILAERIAQAIYFNESKDFD